MTKEDEVPRIREFSFKKVRRNRKGDGYAKTRQEIKYLAIQKRHEEGHTIQILCSIFKLSRASYYKWLNRVETNKEIEELAKRFYNYIRIIEGYLGIEG